MFTMQCMQMFNLVYIIFRDIKYFLQTKGTFCKIKYLMKVMLTLYQYNLCLQKHFIKKGHSLSSEFEGALFKMAGQFC